jgi:hypothetical protein
MLATWTVPGMVAGDDSVTIERLSAGTYRATIVNASGGGVFNSPAGTVTAINVTPLDGVNFINFKSLDVPATVTGGAGLDIVEAESLAATASLLFNGNAGVDRCILTTGGTANLTPVLGDVTFNPGADPGDIVLRDSSSGIGRSYSITAGGISWGTAASVAWSGIPQLRIEASASTNTFEVHELAAGSGCTLAGGAGNDVLRVSPVAQDIGTIDGSLIFQGNGGSNTATLFDGAAVVNANYTVTDNETVDRAGVGVIDCTGISSLTLNSGTGASTFDVTNPALNSATALTINAGDGNDTLNVGPLLGYNMIAPLTFAAGAGTGDRVNLNDSAHGAEETYTLNTTSLTRTNTGNPVNFTGAEQIELRTSSADDTVNVNTLAAGQSATVLGGNGNDKLRVAIASQNLGNVFGSVSFDGEAGTDELSFHDGNYNGNATYNLTGTSLASPGLPTHSYVDTEFVNILGDSGASTFNIDGSGASTLLRLYGNDGNDTFNLAPVGKDWDAVLNSIIFYGDVGTDSVVVDDSVNDAFALYTLGHNASFETTLVDRTASAGLDLVRVESISLKTGTAADQVRVNATGTGIATSINTGAGSDLVELGQSTSVVTNLKGPLSVNLGTRTDPTATQNIIVYDTLSTDANGFNFAPNSMTRSGMGTLTYDVNNDGGLLVYTGSGAVRTHTYADPTAGGADFASVSIVAGAAPQSLFVNGVDQSLGFLNTKLTDELTVTDATPPVGYPQVQVGSTTLNAPVGLNRLTLVGSAAVALGGISAGAVGAGLPPADPNNSTLTINEFSSAAGSRFEINNGAAIFANPSAAAASAIVSRLNTGRNGGAWNAANGITSYAVSYYGPAGAPTRTIGYARANAVLSFPGAGPIAWRATTLGPNDLIVSHTLVGDATLDRTVNFDDLLKLAASYNASGTSWSQGDFTYDGTTNFDDLLKLAANYNATLLTALAGPALLLRPPPPPAVRANDLDPDDNVLA